MLCWSDIRSTKAMRDSMSPKLQRILKPFHHALMSSPRADIDSMHIAQYEWVNTGVTMRSPGSILHGEWGTWETLPLEVSPSARAKW
jgi:hypothetical protein